MTCRKANEASLLSAVSPGASLRAPDGVQGQQLGGGGAHFHLCTCILGIKVCPFLDHHFRPKFPLQSISFSQITKKSASGHHHFRVFAAPETIFKMSLPSSRSVAAHSRFIAAFGQRSGLAYSRPECQTDCETHPTSQVPRPPISHSSPLHQSPAFSCSSHSGAPIFHFAVHIPTKMWAECPPPPPPGPGGGSGGTSWVVWISTTLFPLRIKHTCMYAFITLNMGTFS